MEVILEERARSTLECGREWDEYGSHDTSSVGNLSPKDLVSIS